jgi:ribosomal-protein-alanine N-acetyltransferase
MDPLPCAAQNVVLRRLSVSDLAQFQQYRRDPEVGQYQGWSPMSDTEAAAFLQEMSGAPLFHPGQWAQIGITESQSSLLIGDLGILVSEDTTHAEVGITLSPQSQRRGLATAALRAAIQLIIDFTSVQRVLGICDARNLNSVRLLERVGMSLEEQRKVLFRGQPCVERVYALPRPASPALPSV